MVARVLRVVAMTVARLTVVVAQADAMVLVCGF